MVPRRASITGHVIRSPRKEMDQPVVVIAVSVQVRFCPLTQRSVAVARVFVLKILFGMSQV